MSQDTSEEEPKKRIISGTQMSRQDIIDAVVDPNTVVLENKSTKSIVIPDASSIKADPEKLIQEMEIPAGSLMQAVLRIFCEEKNASASNAKVLVTRMKTMSDEQLKIIRQLCTKKEFTATGILKPLQTIKRFDGPNLLALSAFIDLAGIGPGPLNQFFNTTLPQSKRAEVGDEAYASEIREKAMRPDQTNAFYTVCTQVRGMTTSEAIQALRTIRKLKPQHANMISSLLKKNAVFGDTPVTNASIHDLIKQWLPLPEMKRNPRFRRLVKRLARKTKKQPDFMLIIQTYKEAIASENSGGVLAAIIRRIFG